MTRNQNFSFNLTWKPPYGPPPKRRPRRSDVSEHLRRRTYSQKFQFPPIDVHRFLVRAREYLAELRRRCLLALSRLSRRVCALAAFWRRRLVFSRLCGGRRIDFVGHRLIGAKLGAHSPTSTEAERRCTHRSSSQYTQSILFSPQMRRTNDGRADAGPRGQNMPGAGPGQGQTLSRVSRGLCFGGGE